MDESVVDKSVSKLMVTLNTAFENGLDSLPGAAAEALEALRFYFLATAGVKLSVGVLSGLVAFFIVRKLNWRALWDAVEDVPTTAGAAAVSVMFVSGAVAAVCAVASLVNILGGLPLLAKALAPLGWVLTRSL